MRRDLNGHADFRARDKVFAYFLNDQKNLVELSYELAAPKSLLKHR